MNAEKCRLSPVQRIFTRIGAYDAVLEGKSTWLGDGGRLKGNRNDGNH